MQKRELGITKEECSMQLRDYFIKEKVVCML